MTTKERACQGSENGTVPNKVACQELHRENGKNLKKEDGYE